MKYGDKLKDPRWQRVRLEKMQAAEWKCSACDAEDKPLHVHHMVYLAESEPWDYHPALLRVLCSECHKLTHLSHFVTCLPGVDECLLHLAIKCPDRIEEIKRWAPITTLRCTLEALDAVKAAPDMGPAADPTDLDIDAFVKATRKRWVRETRLTLHRVYGDALSKNLTEVAAGIKSVIDHLQPE